MTPHHSFVLILSLLFVPVATPVIAGQPLETETARLPAQGHGNVQLVYEHQSASNGQEDAFPLAFEYGITDRLEFAIEPVVYTSIRPKAGRTAKGFGDTEATLTYLITPETANMPAFAIAGEVKFSTARNALIGTGGTDYRIAGIASKRYGPFDLHANLGYTFVGKATGGAKLDNIIDLSAAAEYTLNTKWTLVSEVLANSSAGGNEAALGGAQEASASTVTGLVGAVYHPADRYDLSVGVTYDSESAALLRTGLTYRF